MIGVVADPVERWFAEVTAFCRTICILDRGRIGVKVGNTGHSPAIVLSLVMAVLFGIPGMDGGGRNLLKQIEISWWIPDLRSREVNPMSSRTG